MTEENNTHLIDQIKRFINSSKSMQTKFNHFVNSKRNIRRISAYSVFTKENKNMKNIRLTWTKLSDNERQYYQTLADEINTKNNYII